MEHEESLHDGDYLRLHRPVDDGQHSYRSWDHERLVCLPGVQEQDTVTHFVDSLMKVTKQDRINGLREIRKQIFQGKLRASPSRMCHPNPETLDLDDLRVWQGVSQIGGIGVAVDYDRAGCLTAHTVYEVLPDDVAAVYGDVSISYSGANVRVDLVPAVQVSV